ncbi:hypothetical protein CRM90_27330 [Mycobacterium sp. ENV421]|nr:hypothetical protein CRM90_27330 [Mycobacterium sp. ENV421]
MLQAQVDAAERPGVTTAEAQCIPELEREVRDLKEPMVLLVRSSGHSQGLVELPSAGGLNYQRPISTM